MKGNDNKNVTVGCNLKRKFKKLFGISKEDQTNKSEEKEKSERTSYEEGLQFDAVPDTFREKSDSSEELPDNLNNEYLKDPLKKPKESSSTKEKPPFPNDFKSHFNYNEEGKPSTTKPNVIKNETNIVVNGGSGIHIGNVFTTVNNLQGPNNQQSRKSVRVEKTNAIRDLTKSKNIIKSGHLQLLSEHLGKEWKEVGNRIELTTGEIDFIEEKYDTCNERAYQMLNKWRQQMGERATVGALCKKLWLTQVHSAREAVHQLSLSQVD